ncbi:MAG: helix-turn-helix domain-containing protein, partial [Acidobacteriota bacterium]
PGKAKMEPTADVETTFVINVVARWPRPICDQLVDGFASSLVAGLRDLAGARLAPAGARFTRTKPAKAKEFARMLRCEVEFGAARNELVFHSDDLVRPSPLYDAMVYEQLRFMSDLRAEQPSGTGPLRQLVEQALRGGAHSIEQVADTLRVNVRTLQRRLRAEGVTFRRILNEVRMSMAKKLLEETTLSLPEIARRLQYADDKALRKAIRRETGKSPSEIRRQGAA